MTLPQNRIEHELEHGRKLRAAGAEGSWGWGTPAGRLRSERRAELIVAGGALGPGREALEIGCGSGVFTEKFAAAGARVTACELSPDLIELARSRPLAGGQVRFVTNDFMTSDFSTPFDAVVGSSVLHHLEIEAALARIFTLLKPGGRLSFAEPNMMNPQVFLERKLRFIRPLFWYVSPEETAFVRWPLQRLLSKTGFVDVRVTPFDWLHPATPARLIPLLQKIGSGLEKTPVLREFAGSLMIVARKPETGRTAVAG